METETHKCLQLQRQQMQHAKREETGAEVNRLNSKKERVSLVKRTIQTKRKRDHKQICEKI